MSDNADTDLEDDMSDELIARLTPRLEVRHFINIFELATVANLQRAEAADALARLAAENDALKAKAEGLEKAMNVIVRSGDNSLRLAKDRWSDIVIARSAFEAGAAALSAYRGGQE